MAGCRVSEICDTCLRRGALIGELAPTIQGMVGSRDRRVPAILALPDGAFVAALGETARVKAERLLARFDPVAARAGLERAACAAVCRHSAAYPDRLLQLHDPPNPLYVRGGVERLVELAAAPCVAIVGARKSSAYARTVAQELGRRLAAADVTVVSGLALGIDGAAHTGALAGGDTAIAVLGCGPDVVYPKKHAFLHERISAAGAIVAELPPGIGANKWSFPARNRIMAALAQVVVIVEAAEASGSLITADFAQELDCDVAAVPGQVTARAAAGSNGLLKAGAALVRNADDVFDLLFGVGQGNRAPAVETKIEPRLREVLDAVELGESLPDTAGRAGLSAGQLRGALGRLEALGLVHSDGFGGYTRSAL
jgi:DNA processing protein